MKNRKNVYQIVIVAGACLIYLVSGGVRSIYGIMLDAISEETGIDYATVSFAVALGQLVFGIAQPVFGVVALKKSNTFVLVLGSLVIGVGIGVIPFCVSTWMLVLFFGIVLPAGTGAVSYGILVSAITQRLGEEKASVASGLINAASGLGSVVLSPVMQRAFAAVGLTPALLGLAAAAVLMIPLCRMIGGGKKEQTADGTGDKRLPPVEYVFRDRNYLFLLIGFFTCGFHMAIITTHLYSQFLSLGIPEDTAALIYSVYGAAAVAGSLLTGFLCGKKPMKWVVGTLYGSRTLWILGFLLLPKSPFTAAAFAVALGLTGPATAIPTSGLVGKLFGTRNMATLFGIVFAFHQLGSFFSAWLGGVCVEAAGSYTLVWILAAALSAAAMAVSYAIREPKSV